MKMKGVALMGGLCILLLFVTGCNTTQKTGASPQGSGEAGSDAQLAQLEEQQKEINQLKKELAMKEDELNSRLGQVSASAEGASGPVDVAAPLLPPDAKPGECYARVFVPPVYKTVEETRLKKAASQRVEIIPAEYKMVKKKVLVKEASEKLVTIPAEYGMESDQVLVSAENRLWKIALGKNAPIAADTLLATAKEHGIDLDAALPGQCFHEHYLPPVYETVYEDELVSEESYEYQVVPAQYETVTERVLVSEATKELVTEPATYRWVEEKVLVKEAHTAWKKGRGLIERVDNTTGELMCLVNVPAEYRTIKKKVVDTPARTYTKDIPAVYKTVSVTKLVAPASRKKIVIPAVYKKVPKQKMVREGRFVWHEIHCLEHPRHTRTGNQICLVEIPAKYRTVTKKVVVKPAKTVTQAIPAEYKTVWVKTVVSEEKEKVIEIPAEYQTVTKEKQVADGRLEWRQVLCETNTTVDVVRKIQETLLNKGYDPGSIDGVYGWRTERAVKKFQRDNDLATGGLTFETLKQLGL